MKRNGMTLAFNWLCAPLLWACSSAPAATPANPPRPGIALNAKKVSPVRGRYETLDCGSCHGESRLDFSLAEEDFVTFVRSGGELGTAHQYATDRLSKSGSRNLYHCLPSPAQVG